MVSKEVLYKFRFIILILSLIAIDLFSKNLAVINLIYGQTEPTIFPFIDFLLIYNSGIAFGIFNSEDSLNSQILLLITLAISFYLIWMIASEDMLKKKYALSITSFLLENLVINIIARYAAFSIVYKNNPTLLALNTDKAVNRRWLGCISSYYHPNISSQRNPALGSYPETGGLIIHDFILGFDYINKTFVFDTDTLTRATKGYESAIDWIYRRDNSRLLQTLFKKTKVYDKIRNENTVDVFPEWKELFDKYDTPKT